MSGSTVARSHFETGKEAKGAEVRLQFQGGWVSFATKCSG